MEPLAIIWFVAIALLWTGYLLLEGFDLGVGMHMIFSTRSERDRRVMLNTIGPVWDGNEVWLITAVAALFAAFSPWYAALLSALYVPLTLALLGLILRAVGIEYRGKVGTRVWATFWTYMIGLGSAAVAFFIGALLALTSIGLPIDGNGDRVGGPFAWLSWPALVGGLAVVGFALAHSATFLALKADGPVRRRASGFAVRWAPLCLLPLLVWIAMVQFEHGAGPAGWTVALLAVVSGGVGWAQARAGREGLAFTGYAGTGLFGLAAIFLAMFPVLLPSTIDSAFDITVQSAAHSTYTLGVLTVITVVALPVILCYQAWSYWVFRHRVTPGMIPEPHVILPAILRAEDAGRQV
ncbi:cytochrome d ubiquinol oxidase subunit II [Dietzia alimentaria]|uniref:Cytochrome C oxidase assembly protein n=2 Tax=Dietzia TaxID=37914 RepID=A0AAD0JPK6_9ACTN|nr:MULTISPECIES: cytochrome d ubiquinol oxidase subunit II [Dietzia]AWH95388.1 cytochrome C oxidase assembly protein [Dietzia psychralcaliphila]MBB1017085.1 cytochrome d ubiquinol oxidase subunit II [Dietzia sp. DQ11-71]ODQ97447.1 cytochrome d ubiquinol oxidase subunit II [Dietzia alimentaria]PTM85438.1 cytochrome bd-I ubiquinol oxidase subunit 2 apoprotein [Dietzia psychralcaliphila]